MANTTKDLTNRRTKKPPLTLEQALSIRADYAEGMIWRDLCSKYGHTAPTISAVVKGIHASLKGYFPADEGTVNEES